MATIRLNLGSAYAELGRPGDGLVHLNRALEIQEKALGKDHPDVGSTLGGIADLLDAQHRVGEARVLRRRGLAILEAALGKDHPDLVFLLRGLAVEELALGRPVAAIATLERAIAISESSGVAPAQLVELRAALAAARGH